MSSESIVDMDLLRQRPTWLLLAMALPLGIALNFLSGWAFNQLSAVILDSLKGWSEASRLQESAIEMAVNLGLPTLLVFCLLKQTRLGGWLAPNRLTLGSTLLFDAAIVVMCVRRLYLSGSGHWPYWHMDTQASIDATLLGCMIVGVASLALSTIARRTDWSGWSHALRFGQWLWREV